MSTVHWLEPVCDEQPGGINLEYDTAFTTLLALLKPDQRQNFSFSEPTDVQHTVDWFHIHNQAGLLFAKSKDLRLALLLLRSMIHTQGAPSIVVGFEFLAALLERYWPVCHPLLEADDGHDPTWRMNILAELNSPESVLSDLHSANAQGRTLSREQVQATLSAIDRIVCTVQQHAGPSILLDVQSLRQVLLNMQSTSPHDYSLVQTSVAHAVLKPENVIHGMVDLIKNRDDVKNILQTICQYLQHHEPTHPVQLLLQRAQKMLDMNFLQLLEELAPDGWSQAVQVLGNGPKQK